MSYGEEHTDMVGKRGKGQIIQDLVAPVRSWNSVLKLVRKHWKFLNTQKKFDVFFLSHFVSCRVGEL